MGMIPEDTESDFESDSDSDSSMKIWESAKKLCNFQQRPRETEPEHFQLFSDTDDEASEGGAAATNGKIGVNNIHHDLGSQSSYSSSRSPAHPRVQVEVTSEPEPTRPQSIEPHLVLNVSRPDSDLTDDVGPGDVSDSEHLQNIEPQDILEPPQGIQLHSISDSEPPHGIQDQDVSDSEPPQNIEPQDLSGSAFMQNIEDGFQDISDSEAPQDIRLQDQGTSELPEVIEQQGTSEPPEDIEFQGTSEPPEDIEFQDMSQPPEDIEFQDISQSQEDIEIQDISQQSPQDIEIQDIADTDAGALPVEVNTLVAELELASGGIEEVESQQIDFDTASDDKIEVQVDSNLSAYNTLRNAVGPKIFLPHPLLTVQGFEFKPQNEIWDEVYPGVRITHQGSNGINYGFMEIEAKTLKPFDSEPLSKVIYFVQEGKMILKTSAMEQTADGTLCLKKYYYESGEMFFIPPKLPNSFENYTNVPLLLGFVEIELQPSANV